MLGIAIHCIQHSQVILERGVCELTHSFFHCYGDQGRVYHNCKFHDPGAEDLVLGRDHTGGIVKMHYFFKKLSLCL